MIPASTKKVEYTLAPEGTFVARIISLLHIGTNQEEYKGDKFDMNKVRVTFELPTELHAFKEGEDKKPFVVSQDYTLSLGEKANLRPLVKSALNMNDEKISEIEKGMDEYDIADILDKPVQITTIHKTSMKGNKYLKVESVTSLVKGMEIPNRINDLTLLEYDKWDEALFEKLPDFIKAKISSSKEYKEMKGIKSYPTGEENLDNVPF